MAVSRTKINVFRVDLICDECGAPMNSQNASAILCPDTNRKTYMATCPSGHTQEVERRYPMIEYEDA